MSERYGRLFTLPENLYAEGSPVIVAAGALLKDNQTGKVLAQLKFRSISDKIIKAVKVKITPMDTVSQPLGSEVAYQYLDLQVHRDQEFGQKTPISLPDAATRGFSAAVCEVVFSDNTIWQSGGEPWERLKKPVPLYIPVPDEELQKQLRLEYGKSFEYMPDEDRDLWMCACGNWNHQGELTCYRCNQERSRLLDMDMESLKANRDERLAKEAVQAEKVRVEAQAKAKKATKLAAIVLPIVAVAVVAAVLISGSLKKKAAYEEAMALADAGRRAEAIILLEEAGYKDALDQVYNPLYEKAEALLAQGETGRAAIAFEKITGYRDARERSQELWSNALRKRQTISANNDHTVCLREDGTVVAVGNNNKGQCNVSGWKGIVEVAAGGFHTVGLKADGTAVAVGNHDHDRCKVSGWKDIASIYAGGLHTVGLKTDGTVVATGYNENGQCNVSGWNNIAAISAGLNHTVGLKADGTVVATGLNEDGQCDVSDWTDIVAVSAGGYHTVGLKADGTVVVAGFNEYGQCDVSGWKDIAEISAGGFHTVGRKADGTVVAVGADNFGQCKVSKWDQIEKISAGWCYTVGLKSDGTAVAIGFNEKGTCEVSDWSNIKLP